MGSDFRSQMNIKERFRRERQRAKERRERAVKAARSPLVHVGNAEEKYGRMQSRLRKLREDILKGNMTRESLKTAEDLLLYASEEWFYSLVWKWKRGSDGESDVCPGINGETLADLEPWRNEICRGLRDSIRDGSYRPLPFRRIDIPKDLEGNKTRPIDIPCATDWLVEKVLNSVVRDLLEIGLPETTVGFMKWRGHFHAVRLAFYFIEKYGFDWLVATDIKSAFPSIPHGRLRDVLNLRIPNSGLVNLIMRLLDPSRMVNGQRGRGIPQGMVLSPGLLNVFLGHFLDAPWHQAHPGWPMVRYADDLLVHCHSKAESRAVRKELEKMLQPHGLRLAPGKTHRCNIHSQSLLYLGHEIKEINNRLSITVPESSWQQLASTVQHYRAAGEDSTTIRIRLTGWFLYHGPALSPAPEQAINRVETMLSTMEPSWNHGLVDWQHEWEDAIQRSQKEWERVGKHFPLSDPMHASVTAEAKVNPSSASVFPPGSACGLTAKEAVGIPADQPPW